MGWWGGGHFVIFAKKQIAASHYAPPGNNARHYIKRVMTEKSTKLSHPSGVEGPPEPAAANCALTVTTKPALSSARKTFPTLGK